MKKNGTTGTTGIPSPQTWEQVDDLLRRLGEVEIRKNKLEGELTIRVNEVKEQYKEKIDPLIAEADAIRAAITAFAENAKDDFLKTRTKQLNFGVVAYRVTEKILIRSKEACVAALKALGLTQYIRTIEEPDKEALRDMDDKQLAKVGATRKIDDSLRIEPNLEKIESLS